MTTNGLQQPLTLKGWTSTELSVLNTPKEPDRLTVDRAAAPLAAFMREARLPPADIARVISLLPDERDTAGELGRLLAPALPLTPETFSRAKLAVNAPDGGSYRELLDGGINLTCGLDTLSVLFPLRGTAQGAAYRMEFQLAFVYQSLQGFTVSPGVAKDFALLGIMNRLLKHELAPEGWRGYGMHVWESKTPSPQDTDPQAPEMKEITLLAGFGRVLSLVAEAYRKTG